MLYVTRHGQTYRNIEKKICGHDDIELTSKGYEQAEKLANLVANLPEKITHILSSPLKRAKITAEIIGEKNGIPVIIEPRLIEMNFGKFDGQLISTPEFQNKRLEFSKRFESGESILDVTARVYPLLKELSKDKDNVYLLVCHNALARVIDNYFNDKDMADFLNFNMDNTELLKYVL